LYTKLAVALLVLLITLGCLYVAAGIYTTDMYLQEVRQKLNRELAAHLIDDGLLIRDGGVDPESLKHVIHMLMVVNPSIEVYVLDPDGRILAYSSPPGRVRLERVSLEPVREFLADDEGRLLLLGDDPRNPGGRKVFSAGVIGDQADPEGYVYVVLGGQLHDSVVQRLAGSYVLRMGVAAGIAVLAFALVAGLLLFAILTRRLRKLDVAMREFEASGFAAPIAPSGWRSGRGSDEIDRLGRTFQRMAQRIGEQLAELERADRTRRELVANVSHDLRTPLASLHGYLETLLLKGDRIDPEERRRYLEIAARHSGRLGGRVAELFELAKLDACDVRPDPEPFSMAELVQDVAQKFQIETGRKRIRLHTERETGLPFIVADIGLVERVLENLIGNAVRHTPEDGQVTVTVEGEGDGIRVRVQDTGPGIPADELSSVFDRFYRCKTGETSDGGAGLGLAIARRIVELHGGRIRATSQPGQGSVFTFTLPLEAGPVSRS
jgi:signal transduction histidine kinase